jgi:hypothetical protein
MDGLNETNMPTETLNPWFSIWTKPRATIRQILNSKSEAYINTLAIAGGITSALDKASQKNYGDEYGLLSMFILAIFVGAISGLISLYIGSAIVHWTGKWIGGQGEYDEIKVSTAWANIPLIWGLLLWIPTWALLGRESFSRNIIAFDYSGGLPIIAILLGIIAVILGIWTFIIQLKCLAEAQRFSAWAALGNTILAGLVVFVPIFLILLLIAL